MASMSKGPKINVRAIVDEALQKATGPMPSMDELEEGLERSAGMAGKLGAGLASSTKAMSALVAELDSLVAGLTRAVGDSEDELKLLIEIQRVQVEIADITDRRVASSTKLERSRGASSGLREEKKDAKELSEALERLGRVQDTLGKRITNKGLGAIKDQLQAISDLPDKAAGPYKKFAGDLLLQIATMEKAGVRLAKIKNHLKDPIQVAISGGDWLAALENGARALDNIEAKAITAAAAMDDVGEKAEKGTPKVKKYVEVIASAGTAGSVSAEDLRKFGSRIDEAGAKVNRLGKEPKAALDRLIAATKKLRTQLKDAPGDDFKDVRVQLQSLEKLLVSEKQRIAKAVEAGVGGLGIDPKQMDDAIRSVVKSAKAGLGDILDAGKKAAKSLSTGLQESQVGLTPEQLRIAQKQAEDANKRRKEAIEAQKKAVDAWVAGNRKKIDAENRRYEKARAIKQKEREEREARLKAEMKLLDMSEERVRSMSKEEKKVQSLLNKFEKAEQLRARYGSLRDVPAHEAESPSSKHKRIPGASGEPLATSMGAVAALRRELLTALRGGSSFVRDYSRVASSGHSSQVARVGAAKVSMHGETTAVVVESQKEIDRQVKEAIKRIDGVLAKALASEKNQSKPAQQELRSRAELAKRLAIEEGESRKDILRVYDEKEVTQLKKQAASVDKAAADIYNAGKAFKNVGDAVNTIGRSIKRLVDEYPQLAKESKSLAVNLTDMADKMGLFDSLSKSQVSSLNLLLRNFNYLGGSVEDLGTRVVSSAQLFQMLQKDLDGTTAAFIADAKATNVDAESKKKLASAIDYTDKRLEAFTSQQIASGQQFQVASKHAGELRQALDPLKVVIEALEQNRGPVKIGKELDALQKKLKRATKVSGPDASESKREIARLSEMRKRLIEARKSDTPEFRKNEEALQRERNNYQDLTKDVRAYKAQIKKVRAERSKLQSAMSDLDIAAIPEGRFKGGAATRRNLVTQLKSEVKAIEDLKGWWDRLAGSAASTKKELSATVAKMEELRKRLGDALGGKFSWPLRVAFRDLARDSKVLSEIGDKSETMASKVARLGPHFTRLFDHIAKFRSMGKIFIDLTKGAEGLGSVLRGGAFSQPTLPSMRAGFGSIDSFGGSVTQDILASDGVSTLRSTLDKDMPKMRQQIQSELPVDLMDKFGVAARKTASGIEIVTVATSRLDNSTDDLHGSVGKSTTVLHELGRRVAELSLPFKKLGGVSRSMFDRMHKSIADTYQNLEVSVGDWVARQGKQWDKWASRVRLAADMSSEQLAQMKKSYDKFRIDMDAKGGPEFGFIQIDPVGWAKKWAKAAEAWQTGLVEQFGVVRSKFGELTSRIKGNLVTLWTGAPQAGDQLNKALGTDGADIKGLKELLQVSWANAKNVIEAGLKQVDLFNGAMRNSVILSNDLAESWDHLGKNTQASLRGMQAGLDSLKGNLKEYGRLTPVASLTQDLSDSRKVLKLFGGDVQKAKDLLMAFNKVDTIPKDAISEVNKLLGRFNVGSELKNSVTNQMEQMFDVVRSGTASADESLEEFIYRIKMLGLGYEETSRIILKASNAVESFGAGIDKQKQTLASFGIVSKRALEFAAKGARATLREVLRTHEQLGESFLSAVSSPFTAFKRAFTTTRSVMGDFEDATRGAKRTTDGMAESLRDVATEGDRARSSLQHIDELFEKRLAAGGMTKEQIQQKWESGSWSKSRSGRHTDLDPASGFWRDSGAQTGSISPFGRAPSAAFLKLNKQVDKLLRTAFRLAASSALQLTAAVSAMGQGIVVLIMRMGKLVISANAWKLVFQTVYATTVGLTKVVGGLISAITKIPGVIKTALSSILSLVKTVGSAVAAPIKFVVAPLRLIGDLGGAITGAFRKAYHAIFNLRTLLLGAGIGIFLRNLISTAIDFEQSMAKAASVAGATTREMSEMVDLARQMGRETVFKASQSAETFYALASAGLSARESMEALQSTMLLAGATGAELAFTAETVTTSMRAFGKEAWEVNRISNLFAQVIATSPATLGRMAYSMKYAAGITKAFGWQIEDTAATLGMLHRAGFFGEQAGVALRAALVRLARPMRMTLEGMDALNLSASELNPTLNSMSDLIETLGKHQDNVFRITQIVGQEALPAVLAMLRQGSDAWKEYRAELSGTEKATEQYVTMMDTVKSQFKIFLSAMQDLKIAVFGPFAEVAKVGLRALADAVAEVARRFDMQKDSMASGVRAMAMGFSKWISRMVTSTAAFVDVVRPLGRMLWNIIEGPTKAFLRLPAPVQAGGILAALMLGPRRVFNIAAVLTMMNKFSDEVRIVLKVVGSYIDDYLIQPMKTFINWIRRSVAEFKSAYNNFTDTKRASRAGELLGTVTRDSAVRQLAGGSVFSSTNVAHMQRSSVDLARRRVLGWSGPEEVAQGLNTFGSLRENIKRYQVDPSIIETRNPEYTRRLVAAIDRWITAIDEGATDTQVLAEQLGVLQVARSKPFETGFADTTVTTLKETFAPAIAALEGEDRLGVLTDYLKLRVEQENRSFNFVEVDSARSEGVAVQLNALTRAIAVLEQRGVDTGFSAQSVRTFALGAEESQPVQSIAQDMADIIFARGELRGVDTRQYRILEDLFRNATRVAIEEAGSSSLRPSEAADRVLDTIRQIGYSPMPGGALETKLIKTFEAATDRQVQAFQQAMEQGALPETARRLSILARIGEAKGLPPFAVTSGFRTPEQTSAMQKMYDSGDRRFGPVRPESGGYAEKGREVKIKVISPDLQAASEAMLLYGSYARSAAMQWGGELKQPDIARFTAGDSLKDRAAAKLSSTVGGVGGFVVRAYDSAISIADYVPDQVKSLGSKFMSEFMISAKKYMDGDLSLGEIVTKAWEDVETSELPDGAKVWFQQLFGDTSKNKDEIEKFATWFFSTIGSAFSSREGVFNSFLTQSTKDSMLEPLLSGWVLREANTGYSKILDDLRTQRREVRKSVEKGGEFSYGVDGAEVTTDFGIGRSQLSRLGLLTAQDTQKQIDAIKAVDTAQAAVSQQFYDSLLRSVLGGMGARFSVAAAIGRFGETPEERANISAMNDRLLAALAIDEPNKAKARAVLIKDLNAILRPALALGLRTAKTQEQISELFSDVDSDGVAQLWTANLLAAVKKTLPVVREAVSSYGLLDSGVETDEFDARVAAFRQDSPFLAGSFEQILGPDIFAADTVGKISDTQKKIEDLFASLEDGGDVLKKLSDAGFVELLEDSTVRASVLNPLLQQFSGFYKEFTDPTTLIRRPLLSEANVKKYRDIVNELDLAIEKARYFGIEQEKFELRRKLFADTGITERGDPQAYEAYGKPLLERFDAIKTQQLYASFDKERASLRLVTEAAGKYGSALYEVEAAQELLNKGVSAGTEMYSSMLDAIVEMKEIKNYHDYLKRTNDTQLAFTSSLQDTILHYRTIAEEERKALARGAVAEAVRKSLDAQIREISPTQAFEIRVRAIFDRDDVQGRLAALKELVLPLAISGQSESAVNVISEGLGKILTEVEAEARKRIAVDTENDLIRSKYLQIEVDGLNQSLDSGGVGFLNKAREAGELIETAGEDFYAQLVRGVDIGRGSSLPAVGPDLYSRRGGPVPGGFGGGDVVPAMLEPGEFVLRKEAVQAYGLGQLFSMNSQKFAGGGIVTTSPSDLVSQVNTLQELLPSLWHQVWWYINGPGTYIPKAPITQWSATLDRKFSKSRTGFYSDGVIGIPTKTADSMEKYLNYGVAERAGLAPTEHEAMRDHVTTLVHEMVHHAEEALSGDSGDLYQSTSEAMATYLSRDIMQHPGASALDEYATDPSYLAPRGIYGYWAGLAKRYHKSQAAEFPVGLFAKEIFSNLSRWRFGYEYRKEHIVWPWTSIPYPTVNRHDMRDYIMSHWQKQPKWSGFLQDRYKDAPTGRWAKGGPVFGDFKIPTMDELGIRMGAVGMLASLAEMQGWDELAAGLLRAEREVGRFTMAVGPIAGLRSGQGLMGALTPIEKEYMVQTNKSGVMNKLIALENKFGPVGDSTTDWAPSTKAIAAKVGVRLGSGSTTLGQIAESKGSAFLEQFSLGKAADLLDDRVLKAIGTPRSSVGRSQLIYDPFVAVQDAGRMMGYHSAADGTIALSTSSTDSSLTALGHELRHEWQLQAPQFGKRSRLPGASGAAERDAYGIESRIPEAIEEVVGFHRYVQNLREAPKGGLRDWARRAILGSDVASDVMYPLSTKFTTSTPAGSTPLSAIVSMIQAGDADAAASIALSVLRANPEVVWTSLQHSIGHYAPRPNIDWMISEKLWRRGAGDAPQGGLPFPNVNTAYQDFFNIVSNKIAESAFDKEAPAFAAGGKLPGWGGGDRVQALLEPGEFVFNKEAVNKYGLDLMHMMNAQKLQTGGVVQSIALLSQGGSATNAASSPDITTESGFFGLGVDASEVDVATQAFDRLTDSIGDSSLSISEMSETFKKHTATVLSGIEQVVGAYGKQASAAAAAAVVTNEGFLATALVQQRTIYLAEGNASAVAGIDDAIAKLGKSTKDTDKASTRFTVDLVKGTKISLKGLQDLIKGMQDLPTATSEADFTAGLTLLQDSVTQYGDFLPAEMRATAEDTGAAWEEALGLYSDRTLANQDTKNKAIRDAALEGGASWYQVQSKYLMDSNADNKKYWAAMTAMPMEYASGLQSVLGEAQKLFDEQSAAGKVFGATSITTDTAIGVMKAMQLPFPLNWAQATAVSALGMKQLAEIGAGGGGGSVSAPAMGAGKMFAEGTASEAAGSSGDPWSRELARSIDSLSSTIDNLARSISMSASDLSNELSSNFLSFGALIESPPWFAPITTRVGTASTHQLQGSSVFGGGLVGQEVASMYITTQADISHPVFGAGTSRTETTNLQTVFAPFESGFQSAIDSGLQRLDTTFVSAMDTLGLTASDAFIGYTRTLDLDVLGKSEDEIRAALQNAFGVWADTQSELLFPSIRQFVDEGEQLYETLLRLTRQTKSVDYGLAGFGLTMEDLGVKAGAERINFSDYLVDIFGGEGEIISVLDKIREKTTGAVAFASGNLGRAADSFIESLDAFSGQSYSSGSVARAPSGGTLNTIISGILDSYSVREIPKSIAEYVGNSFEDLANNPDKIYDAIDLFNTAFTTALEDGLLADPEVFGDWINAQELLVDAADAADDFNSVMSEFVDIVKREDVGDYIADVDEIKTKYADTLRGLSTTSSSYLTIVRAQSIELAELEKERITTIKDALDSLEPSIDGQIGALRSLAEKYRDVIEVLDDWGASTEDYLAAEANFAASRQKIVDEAAREAINAEISHQRVLLDIQRKGLEKQKSQIDGFSNLYSKAQDFTKLLIGDTAFRDVSISQLQESLDAGPNSVDKDLSIYMGTANDWLGLIFDRTVEQISDAEAQSTSLREAMLSVRDTVRDLKLDAALAPIVSYESYQTEYQKLREVVIDPLTGAIQDSATGEEVTAYSSFVTDTLLPYLRVYFGDAGEGEAPGQYQKVFDRVVGELSGFSDILETQDDPLLSFQIKRAKIIDRTLSDVRKTLAAIALNTGVTGLSGVVDSAFGATQELANSVADFLGGVHSVFEDTDLAMKELASQVSTFVLSQGSIDLSYIFNTAQWDSMQKSLDEQIRLAELALDLQQAQLDLMQANAAVVAAQAQVQQATTPAEQAVAASNLSTALSNQGAAVATVNDIQAAVDGAGYTTGLPTATGGFVDPEIPTISAMPSTESLQTYLESISVTAHRRRSGGGGAGDVISPATLSRVVHTSFGGMSRPDAMTDVVYDAMVSFLGGNVATYAALSFGRDRQPGYIVNNLDSVIDDLIDILGSGGVAAFLNEIGVAGYSTGAWDTGIGKGVSGGSRTDGILSILHPHEMVIREDDAPSVREYLRAAGLAEKYGASSYANGAWSVQSAVQLEKKRETLAEIIKSSSVVSIHTLRALKGLQDGVDKTSQLDSTLFVQQDFGSGVFDNQTPRLSSVDATNRVMDTSNRHQQQQSLSADITADEIGMAVAKHLLIAAQQSTDGETPEVRIFIGDREIEDVAVEALKNGIRSDSEIVTLLRKVV